MIYFRLVLSCLLVTAILSPAIVSAQDFGKLLEAVDKLESNLKVLVDKEARNRESDIEELRLDLKSLAQDSGTPGQGTEIVLAIESLKHETAELKTQLHQLSNSVQSFEKDNLRIAGLFAELEFLSSELDLISRSKQVGPAQLVSADDGVIALPSNSTPDTPAIAATEGDAERVQLSGFLDVTAAVLNTGDDKTEFSMGQAELDLASEISPRVAAEVAIAYNNDDGVFELGAATVGMNLTASETGFLSSLDLTAGQFDVPFGIDYHRYASVDRRLISGPLAVAHTHEGWNDLGLQLSMESSHGNLVIYGVNGFESSAEIIDEAQSLALGEEVLEEIDTSPANAFGGRLGVTPIAGLEVGSSVAIGFNKSGSDEMVLFGGDLQYSAGRLDIRGEFIHHSLNRSVAKENNRGYYLQSLYNFDRFFITGRYGSFKPQSQDWIGQLTLGTGYSPVEGIELRFESLIGESNTNTINTLQLLAAF